MGEVGRGLAAAVNDDVELHHATDRWFHPLDMSKAPFNIREVRDIAAWRVHGTAKGRKVVQELDAEARCKKRAFS